MTTNATMPSQPFDIPRGEAFGSKSTSRPMRDRFYVSTWDADKQAFTAQMGVRTGPYSKWGLRKALRKIRGDGYQISPRRCAFMVLVENRMVTL